MTGRRRRAACSGRVLPAAQWAAAEFGTVEVGDVRRTRRAVALAAKLAAHPAASLPAQVGSRSALVGAYRLLNQPEVTMDALLAPHRQQTLGAAGDPPVVLFVEDTTELDFTAHPQTTGLGPVGNEHGRGLLLHSTLAVVPDAREVLGLAHAQVVVRQERATPKAHRRHTAEGGVWEVSAQQVGPPPDGHCWVHVSDRESDNFAYLATCLDLGKHVLVRAYQNRVLVWDGTVPPASDEPPGKLLDYARSLPARADGGYTVAVSARPGQPARRASVVLQWAPVIIPPGAHAQSTMQPHAPLALWLLRVWEPAPPVGAAPVAWVLLSDLPITTVAEAHRAVQWYSCRWLCEDFHQCLKTGCQIERSQLDDGADLQRLLGLTLPVAVRLLRLRQSARQTPNRPALTRVDPGMVRVLAARLQTDAETLTLGAFWQAVARLGGFQGRRRDGPPGWRTLWKGWRYLADLTEGARLIAGTLLVPNARSV